MENNAAVQLKTIEETAKILVVSANTTRRLVRAKKIRKVHVGRQIRISMDAINEYIQKMTVPATM